jgi:hypothetical protein
LFSFGYALVFVEIRYLWLCSFLLLLMGGSCYDHLVARGSLPGLKAAFVLVVLVVSFAYQPAHTLVAQRYTGSEEYRSAQAFAAYIPAGAKIVSSGSRGASICLAYYLKAQYYGVVKSNGNMPEMEAILRQYGIDHYLLWEETGANALVFTAYEHVPTPGIKTPTLYRRKGNVTRPNGDPKIKIRVSLIDPACPFS